MLYIFGNRIIEIEWSVKNDKPFQPSPKKSRKHKDKAKKKRAKVGGSTSNSGPVGNVSGDTCSDQEKVENILSSLRSPVRGKEKENLTVNARSHNYNLRRSPPKRQADAMLEEDFGTPPRAKRGRLSERSEESSIEPNGKATESKDCDWEEWEPPQLVKKARRKIGRAHV